MNVRQIIGLDIISSEEFNDIWKSRPTEQHYIKIYGKLIPVPRTQVLYGVGSYKFSGTTLKAESLEFPNYIQKCIDYVKTYSPDINWNGALVNFYADGSQYISPHSDDEKDLVDGSAIWSFSFGGERIFRIRDKHTKNIINDYITYNNSVIIMPGGNFQSNYTHEITKTKKYVSPRINVTIRSFN